MASHRCRYLSLSEAILRPPPRRSPSPAVLLLGRSPQRSIGSDDAAAPRRHLHMADDGAVVAGAAVVHCDDDHEYQQQDDVIMLRRPTRSGGGRAFPPPISVIGKGGRPWLSLRAHREGGRLVLREMRLPSQELLQPCKEDGRFKLLIHPEAARARPCGGGGTIIAGTASQG